MPVVLHGFCPHPPIMVPEVGRGEEVKVAATRRAMLELGRRIGASGAEVLVMISPHAPLFRDVIGISGQEELSGHLGQFGAAGVRLKFRNDLGMVREIVRQAGELGVPVRELDAALARRVRFDPGLDHGLAAPLYFIRQAGVDLPLVAVSMGLFDRPRLYRFGLAVARAAGDRKVAFVASGDLSHRLSEEAPGGYSPRAGEFDRALVDLVRAGDVRGLLTVDGQLAEQAGECGYRSLVMLLGSLGGRDVTGEVLSYEGPFGVGYLVAELKAGREEESLLGTPGGEGSFFERPREGESFLVRVARETLERERRGEKPPEYGPGNIPPEFARRAGVFVSLKKDKELRGCIGTIGPVQKDVVAEVMANAVSAGTGDPRFYPVQPEELPDLEYSVDVLGDPEPVPDLAGLNPGRYGVIVRSGRRSGLLLPDLEGIDTVEEQVAIARQKAGIGPDEPVELFRFEVTRYH